MKRSAEPDAPGRSTAAKAAADAVPAARSVPSAEDEIGEFEDPHGDDFESDGEIIELDTDDEQPEPQPEPAQEAFVLPHLMRPLGPDEVLEADPSVYEMLHTVNMPWPCLTLDVLPDGLGDERRTYPATVYVATATQAERPGDNELLTMKLSLLAKTLEEEDELDDEDVEPVMMSDRVPLQHTTNRVRVSPHAAHTGEYLTAVSQENGCVQIYDVAQQVRLFDTPGMAGGSRKPLFSVGHAAEGYGLDWLPLLNTGALLSGDTRGNVLLTTRTTSRWVTELPFSALLDSIEDIQWLTGETTVFATAGCDGYVRIWDTRLKKRRPVISVQALATDVNVISWSTKISHLLALGHDDGSWGVWDLRAFGKADPVAHYDFHKSAVTALSFNPADELIVAVSLEDNSVTLWDLAVEADDEEIAQQKRDNNLDIPPQLLFVHWQRDVKDVRWHKQIPGCLVSTGGDGLNVWKTISV